VLAQRKRKKRRADRDEQQLDNDVVNLVSQVCGGGWLRLRRWRAQGVWACCAAGMPSHRRDAGCALLLPRHIAPHARC
jgi:hypothetical protein